MLDTQDIDWASYGVYAGALAVVFLLSTVGFLMNVTRSGTLTDSTSILGLAVLSAGILFSGLLSAFCIWTDKDTATAAWEFAVVFGLVAITVFVYPLAYFLNTSRAGDDTEAGASGVERSVAPSTAVAVGVVLLSGVGGPIMMAFTALIVGLVWVIHQGKDERSPAAEKLDAGDYSVGRTLIHKALGGKGKK